MNTTLESKGFSFIELILALFIASILAMIAIPLYFSYTDRAAVQEAEDALMATKTAVLRYQLRNRTLPTSMSDIEEYGFKKIDGKYSFSRKVTSIEIKRDDDYTPPILTITAKVDDPSCTLSMTATDQQPPENQASCPLYKRH